MRTSKSGQARLRSRPRASNWPILTSPSGKMDIDRVWMYVHVGMRQRQDGETGGRDNYERRGRDSRVAQSVEAMQRLSAGLAYTTTRAVSGDRWRGKRILTFRQSLRWLEYLPNTSGAFSSSSSTACLLPDFGLHSVFVKSSLLHEPYQRVPAFPGEDFIP